MRSFRALAAMMVAGALLPAFAIADEPRVTVVPAPGGASISLSGSIAELRDPSRTLTLDEARSADAAGRFTPVAGSRVNHGFTQDAYWYRVALRGPADDAASDWVVEVDYPLLDHLDFHVVRPEGAVESVATGDLRPPSLSQLDVPAFAVPLRLERGVPATLYLRVQTDGQHLVPLALWRAPAFSARAAHESLVVGGFYGVLLAALLSSLVVLVWIRDRAYLWYVLFIAATLGLLLLFNGQARQFGNGLWPDAPRWTNAMFPVFNALSSLLALLFTREFLQTRVHAPRIDRTLAALAVAGVALVVATALLSYAAGNRLVSLYVALAAAMALGAGIALSLKRVRAAHFFLVAWATPLALALLAALSPYGIVHSSALTQHGSSLGLCIAVILLSLALADRVNQERREKFAARHEMLTAREQALADRERMGRLKGFLPQRLAELIVADRDSTLLEPRRRDVTVCVIDLRGFTPFAESVPPDVLMAVLRQFYAAMGDIVEAHGGAVEHFAGDSMLIFFNAPLPLANPEERAARAALEMQRTFAGLREDWARHGRELGLGIGIAHGPATVGAIGFSGRSQYAAIGPVSNLASRLCSIARHGEVLTTSAVRDAVRDRIETQSAGEQPIKGFQDPAEVVRVLRVRDVPAPSEEGRA